MTLSTQMASLNGFVGLVEVLLEFNADPHVKNEVQGQQYSQDQSVVHACMPACSAGGALSGVHTCTHVIKYAHM